ncbi:MAG: MGDG synthase family glycosyltransferase [Solirubrobacteraceae bacterium]
MKAADPGTGGTLPGVDRVPSRVLILSAEMGEGHNAAAAALEQAIAVVWPGCVVERCDTWGLWGRRVSRAATWGYRFQMTVLPATYQVLYDWMCRSDWFAAVTKAITGWFFGWPLQRLLASADYDLVISTYPFSSAGLDWMHTHRGCRVPTVTHVPALHVHPCWAYPTIDQHYVMYDTATEHARTEGFEKTMRLGAPPVSDQFGSLGKHEARQRLHLHESRFVVLISGGALALGAIAESVRALARSEQDLQVIVVCGRAHRLAAELRAINAPPDRLRVLDYVDNVHELMAAADVVVTNGAGVTVLEALCTPRPVIAFRPLAGHGKASTDELIRRDLALVADDVPALVAVVARLAGDRALMARMQEAGERWAHGRDLCDDVREMGRLLTTTARQGHQAPPNGQVRGQSQPAVVDGGTATAWSDLGTEPAQR